MQRLTPSGPLNLARLGTSDVYRKRRHEGFRSILKHVHSSLTNTSYDKNSVFLLLLLVCTRMI